MVRISTGWTDAHLTGREDGSDTIGRAVRRVGKPGPGGEPGIARSTFYECYKRFQEEVYAGLANRSAQPWQTWNRISDEVREEVVDKALEFPEKSPRELAWHIVDHEEYYISETSVYRILKASDLVSSPVYQIVSAAEEFENKTTFVNEMWQTDFTQFKVIN